MACVPSPLPRWDCRVRLSSLPRRRRPSPLLWRVGSHVGYFGACSVFTARYGPHDLLASFEKPFLGVLQSTRHLLDRPQCFRLGRASPVGVSTRGFQMPSQGTHNNASERSLRSVAVGRKNYLFAGSDAGGESAAILYSAVGTCRRLGLDPFAYLRDALIRLPSLPGGR